MTSLPPRGLENIGAGEKRIFHCAASDLDVTEGGLLIVEAEEAGGLQDHSTVGAAGQPPLDRESSQSTFILARM